MQRYKKILHLITQVTIIFWLTACQQDDIFKDFPKPDTHKITTVTNKKIYNREAPIPPQCYTQTEQVNNPCYVCHQTYSESKSFYLNKKSDGNLQGDYAFSDIGMTNQWSNLFEDRTDWVNQISDEAIIRYVNTENYSQLRKTLKNSNFQGFIPDLKHLDQAAEAFYPNGLAKDGSHWVAFNYKTFSINILAY